MSAYFGVEINTRRAVPDQPRTMRAMPFSVVPRVADEFPADRLVQAKARTGQSISVCLPARDEAATVGAIVSAIRGALVDDAALVDEIVVMDDGSTEAYVFFVRSRECRRVGISEELCCRIRTRSFAQRHSNSRVRTSQSTRGSPITDDLSYTLRRTR